jgi:hypothetical protein
VETLKPFTGLNFYVLRERQIWPTLTSWDGAGLPGPDQSETATRFSPFRQSLPFIQIVGSGKKAIENTTLAKARAATLRTITIINPCCLGSASIPSWSCHFLDSGLFSGFRSIFSSSSYFWGKFNLYLKMLPVFWVDNEAYH